METVVRRLVHNNGTDVYYCNISYNLEKLQYNFKSERDLLEASVDSDTATFKNEQSVVIPTYIRDMYIDSNTEGIVKSRYRISDSGNLFSKIYTSFKYKDIADFLYGKDFVFDTKSITMKDANDNVLNLLNPIKYWCTSKQSDKHTLLYSDCSEINALLGTSIIDNTLLVKDLDIYVYPLFHTVLIDLAVYLEYRIMEVSMFNLIGKSFNNDERKTLKLLEKPIERHSKNETPGIIINDFINNYMNLNSLELTLDSINQNFGGDTLPKFYGTVINDIEFINDNTFSYKSFTKLYNKALLKYIEACLMFIKFDFIKSMIKMPYGFTGVVDSLETPVGNLIIEGGDIHWEQI